MNTPDTVDMADDFDGWLSSVPPFVRTNINTALAAGAPAYTAQAFYAGYEAALKRIKNEHNR